MSKNSFAIALFVVVVVLLGYFLLGPNAASSPVSDTLAEVSVNPEATAVSSGSVKEFTVTGDNFSYIPSVLTVKKGDTVRILFKNAQGFHDLKIDEFGVATKKIGAGAEETIEFVADKAGSFEYYCSVGNHRAMGMKGTLTVE